MYCYGGRRHVSYRFFTTGNFCVIEAPPSWATCCPQRDCAGPLTSGTQFVRPEIYAVRLARIARYETRVDTLRNCGDETSVCNGRCRRPRIAEISGYSKVGRVYLFGRRRTRNFPDPTSQLEVKPRSVFCARFTVKSAYVFCS